MELSEVKQAIAKKTVITWDGGNYYVTACILRIRDNRWYYYLELQDHQANSVVIVPMEDINL